MKTSFNFRSVVFKRAYRIIQETGCTMSMALVEAWKRYREYKDKTVKEISTRINGFDFYYFRSDDDRVYRRWSAISDEIRTQLSALPRFFVNAVANQLSNHNYIKSFI